mmetsp:Transcript_61228/g.162773  ORF Transcript_61228/g.162773 Transcript_61228/m.162773 type:complete len:214 (-) Transcript_61228:559-1200(-)
MCCLAEDFIKKRVVTAGVEKIVEEQEFRCCRVYEQHLVAPEQLLVVVLHTVFVCMGNDGILFKLFQDSVSPRQGENVALVLQIDCPPKPQTVQKTSCSASSLTFKIHKQVCLCWSVFQFQLLQRRSVRLELPQVDPAHRRNVVLPNLLRDHWVMLRQESVEKLEPDKNIPLENLQVGLRPLQGVDLLKEKVLDPGHGLGPQLLQFRCRLGTRW